MNITSSLIGQAITFAILVWFTMKFVWPPIVKALDERSAQIAEGLSAADRAKQDLNSAEKLAADRLREAKQQASEILAQAETRASQIIDEAKQDAKLEGDRFKVGAQAEIEQQIEQAREALRQQVADLALSGAEKILSREIDAARHAELLTSLKSGI